MSVEDAADRLAGRLQRPVVVYDTELRLVAFSAHADDVDPVRVSIILARRASDRARTMIAAAGVHRVHAPVRIPRDPATGAPARVAYPVWRHGRLLGYVVYIDDAADDAIPDWQRQILAEATDEIARHLDQRGQAEALAEARTAVLLPDLLAPEPGARATAGRALLAEDLLQPGPAYTAVVLQPADGRPEPDMRCLAEGLDELLRLQPGTACGAVLGSRAVAVTSRPIDPTELGAALETVAPAALAAGIGDPRTSLSDVVSSHRHAAIAAQAPTLLPGIRTRVACWADLGVDQLLLQLPLGDLTVDELPSSVQRLLGTGRGRALVATLDCYLDCGGDAQQAARRLAIHRSTLYYRLDRIRQLTGVDLADGRTRRELHVGLRVAALAGLTTDRAGEGRN